MVPSAQEDFGGGGVLDLEVERPGVFFGEGVSGVLKGWAAEVEVAGGLGVVEAEGGEVVVSVRWKVREDVRDEKRGYRNGRRIDGVGGGMLAVD